MSVARTLAAIAATVLLAACSFENRYEREADRITQAMIANDLRPVQGDIAPDVKITRVQVAQASDELSSAGRLLSVKETTGDCPPEYHCFDARFEKRIYLERLRLDENGKVAAWSYHLAPAALP